MDAAAGNLVAQAHSMTGKPLDGWAKSAFRDSMPLSEAASGVTAAVWSKTNYPVLRLSRVPPSDLSESPRSTAGSH
jgi:hypothetical protein